MINFCSLAMALTTLVLVTQTSPARAETDSPKSESKALTIAHSECTELLDPNAPTHHVQPWFHPDNPLTKDVALTFMRHKFAEAFTFSPDGRYIAIHHDIYPDAEQITLRSLDTGEKLSSLLWRGKGERLFQLRSVAFDGDSRQVVAFAENSFTDDTDAVVTWNGNAGSLVEHIEIQPPQNQDYVRVDAYGNNHSFRTQIALDQPYYVRSLLRSSGSGNREEPKEYAAQIVDWQSKQILTLPGAAVSFLNVVNEPLNARFRYVAVLNADRQTVQLTSFTDIARAMAKASAPAGLLARVQQKFAALIGPTAANGAPALPGPAKGQGLAAMPEFSAPLIHDERVTKVVLSNWAPFAVTQTKSGLHVWNVRTGNEIGSIRGQVQNFRVLERMGLLAYTDGRNLFLYSLLQARQVANFRGFTFYNLDSRLENRVQGVAYVTLDDGTVIKVTETIPENSTQPLYDVHDTGLKLTKPMNNSYRTEVQTKSGAYLVQIYEADKTLRLEVYNLQTNAVVPPIEFPVRAFQSQFSVDPTGQTVLYTSDETQTGILHLKRLLEERGL